MQWGQNNSQSSLVTEGIVVKSYTALASHWLKCLGWVIFFAGHQVNHQNFIPSLISKNLWLILMGMKHFFWNKRSKMANSKKVIFSKSTILNIFFRKFQILVLGLVRLIDEKGINVLWGCPTSAHKQAKNAVHLNLHSLFILRNN